MNIKIITLLAFTLIFIPMSNPLNLASEKVYDTPSIAEDKTAFINATLLTMTDEGVLTNHTVLVQGDSIIEIGPSASLKVPPGFNQINAEGKYLLPGLADMHVHLSGRENLVANLRYGVTSVLQMSGQRGDIIDFLSLREEIRSGKILGPRLYLTGPMFARYGLPRTGSAYAMQAEDVPNLLKKHIQAGYDFIKVHNFTTSETYNTLANNPSIPVIGHIPIAVKTEEALPKQVMVAHSSIFYYQLFYDPSCDEGVWQCMTKIKPDFSQIESLVDKVRQSGIYVTANLSYLAAEKSNDDDWQAVLNDPEFQYLDPSLQARWRVDNPLARGDSRKIRRKDIDIQSPFVYELVQRMNLAGVPILAGTDSGVEGLFPGKAIHLELKELVTAGLSPIDALKSATSNAGDFFNKYVPNTKPQGRIKEGYVADFVLLNANPLENIDNTEKISGTMVGGVWHSLEDLEKIRNEGK